MAGEELYALPARVTVDQVEKIKNQLLDCLHSPETCLEVSGRNVSTVDAAGLQLLISFYKSVSKDQKQLVIVEPSLELSTVLANCGADKVLLTREGF